MSYLIAVSDGAHSGGDLEDVPVTGKDVDVSLPADAVVGVGVDRGEDKLQDGVVNVREVAAAAGVVALGVQGKRVVVDVFVGDLGVVHSGDLVSHKNNGDVKVGSLVVVQIGRASCRERV